MHVASRLAVTTAATFALLATGCASSGSSTLATSTSGSLPGSSVVASVPALPTTGPATSATPATSAASATSAGATTTAPGGVDPNAPEIVAPGDIPDNQVFIAFTSSDGVYSFKVPEGWARTQADGAVTFTDKYNSITARSTGAATPPSVDSVKAGGLADVSGDPTFKLLGVQPVTRKAGLGVLVTYEIGSAASPVTGKKAILAVERYVFFHNGTLVTLTLAGAKGADNVDPWKTVTDSLAWK